MIAYYVWGIIASLALGGCTYQHNFYIDTDGETGTATSGFDWRPSRPLPEESPDDGWGVQPKRGNTR